MSFYLEIECEKYKPDTYSGILILLRDSPLIGGINNCKSIVMESYRNFKSKNRNTKRNTKIRALRIVDESNYHQTVFEVKM